MELIERPNMTAVKYLYSIKYDTFKNDCQHDAEMNGEKKPTEKDMKTWFSILQQFCKTNIKTKGITKRIYSYSQATPAGGGGRLFGGGSMQGIWGVYRGLLMKGVGTDIDMANCHPVLLRYICNKHNIPCPQLEYYINHRDECLADFPSRTVGKNAYLVATNNDKILRGKDLPGQLKKYDKEMKEIQRLLVELPDYKGLQITIPEYKMTKNFNGCAMNRILCFYENTVLQHAIHVINKYGIEIAILMFDGLMAYGDHYANLELLKEIETYVEEQMEGLNMKWTYKGHDETLRIPIEFDVSLVVEIDEWIIKFNKIYPEFEKTHCKIINSSLFIKETPNKFIFMSKNQLVQSYEHIECGFSDSGTPVRFIERWVGFNDKIRRKEDMDFYPPPLHCPDNMFNLWRPFAMELLTTPYDKKETELKFILNHIKILCNNDVKVFDYFIKWVAQMIQYPATKTIIPVLISKEGAGKGTFLKLMKLMFGDEKVFETSTPSRDVWGDFNGIMTNCFLVNLNELGKAEIGDNGGRLKALVTDTSITINNKGVNQFKASSYHRFIITTNKEDPIKTSDDDRRNFIIRSSDELCKNYDYFKEINGYLDNINVIRTCFDYFKNEVEVGEVLGDIPQTEYQQNLKEVNRSAVDLWLEDFTRKNVEVDKVEKLGGDTYKEFEHWRKKNNVNFETSSVKLGIMLLNLQLSKGCIEKGRHTKKGDTKYFDISLLKQHFKIGVLDVLFEEPVKSPVEEPIEDTTDCEDNVITDYDFEEL